MTTEQDFRSVAAHAQNLNILCDAAEAFYIDAVRRAMSPTADISWEIVRERRAAHQTVLDWQKKLSAK